MPVFVKGNAEGNLMCLCVEMNIEAFLDKEWEGKSK